MLCPVALYLSIALGVTLMARGLIDPYGHRQLTNFQAWREAAFYGVFWLPFILYVFALIAWDWVRSNFLG